MFNTPIGKTIFPVKPINLGCEFISGYAFKGSDFVETGHPVIKIKNIQNGRVTTEHSQFVSDEIITDKLTRFRLDDGDILIAMTGQGSVGRVGKLYLFEDNKPYLNQRVGKFVADEKILNIDFLYYVISTQAYENYLFSAGSGSGQPNLSPAIIKSIEIPYPPYDVQCHIGKVLKDIDNKIELNRQTNQTLEQIAQAIFKSWFVDFEPTRAKIIAQDMGANSATQELAAQAIICGAITLEQLADTEPQTLSTWLEQSIQQKLSQANPTGINPDQLKTTAALFPNALVESELGDVPEGWGIKTIKNLSTKISKGTTPRRADIQNAKDPKSIVFLKVRDISDDGEITRVDLDTVPESIHVGALKRSILETHDILFSIAGTIGRVAVVDKDLSNSNCNQAVAFIRLVEPARHLEICRLNLVGKRVQNEAAARVVQGVQANFSLTSLGEVSIIIPCENLLSEFNDAAAAIRNKRQNLMAENRALEEIRDLLLPKLLSGELDVSALADNSEADA